MWCCLLCLLFCSTLILTAYSLYFDSAKLIDIYRTCHNISASTGLSDPAVATGISDLIYEATKPAPAEPDTLDDDLVNAWAANLGDDGLWGKNTPAMSRVRYECLVFFNFDFDKMCSHTKLLIHEGVTKHYSWSAPKVCFPL